MLLLPAGVFELLSWERVDDSGFNAMHQPARLAGRRDQVIPAPGDMPWRMKTEDPIGQRVAFVVVEEQPAVKFLAAQCFLYPENVHAIRE